MVPLSRIRIYNTGMHLHSRALLHFETIRRANSIREAARQLHLSSSALNRQLLALESEIGHPLFERLPGGLKLTHAGEILSRHVITVMQDAQRMTQDLDALRGVRRGVVDLLTVESLTADFIPQILQEMARRYPSIELRVRITGSVEAANQVSQGHADIAICFLRNRIENLSQISAARFPLGVIVSPEHVLAKHKSVTLTDALQHKLVLPTHELALYDDISALLSDYRGDLDVALRTGSFELMRQFTIQRNCLALVNCFGIEKEVQAGCLIFIPLRKTVLFNLGIYVRAERALSPALDAFVEIASDEVQKRKCAN
ncbi:MAG: LysR family transcriptional regulator [Pseudomonadota bacterium]